MIGDWWYIGINICIIWFVVCVLLLLRKVLRVMRKKNVIVVFKKINKYCKSLYLVVV